MDVPARAHRQPVGVERIDDLLIRRSENTEVGIFCDFPELRLCVKELSEQFSGLAALALLDVHHGAFVYAAVADGQYYARVHVGNGVAERAKGIVRRVVKAQRADAGGAVAHPRAQPVSAVGGVERRNDADRHRLLAARHLQHGLAALADESAQLLRTGHRRAVDAQNAVAGPDARLIGRAGRLAHVRGADDHHALGQQRHAHGLPAGNERALFFHRHRNGLDRYEAQQAVGERRLPGLLARGERHGVAKLGSALVETGNDRFGAGLQFRAAGKREAQLRLRAGCEEKRVRQALKGAQRRRHARGGQRRRQQKPRCEAPRPSLFHGNPSLRRLWTPSSLTIPASRTGYAGTGWFCYRQTREKLL